MKFGLLGKTLKHSYSKEIHNILFKEKNIDASYDLLEVNEDELESTLNKIRTKEYLGFNVTIPYKKTIMKYLDVIDDISKDIKAVNTVYLKDGLLHGTNTDYFGFIEELKYYKIDVHNKDCYILGTGGASNALYNALKDLSANVKLVSRKPVDGQISYSELDDVNSLDVIINATPVGMFPNINNAAISENTAKRAKTIVDIIFNPSITKLMSYNKNSYNGLMMLLMQAMKSEDIWLNKEYNIDHLKIYNKVREVIKSE